MHCRLLAVTLLASLVLGQEIPNVPVETNQRPGEVVGQWESTNNNVGADPVGPPQKTDDLPEYLRKLARQLKKYQRIENTVRLLDYWITAYTTYMYTVQCFMFMCLNVCITCVCVCIS